MVKVNSSLVLIVAFFLTLAAVGVAGQELKGATFAGNVTTPEASAAEGSVEPLSVNRFRKRWGEPNLMENKSETAGDKGGDVQEPQDGGEENNGTDPTRLISSAQTSSEYTSLKGDNYNLTTKFFYSRPFGKSKRSNYQLKFFLVNNNALDNNTVGIGDFAVKVNHVAKVTRSYGIVFSGEMSFATASRRELGAGKNVAKGTFIYAKFLKNGYIIAPSIQQSVSLWGKDNRANVNNTVFDLYIVPKLKDPKTFITIDPAFTIDYEGKKEFGAVAVTVGRSVGKLFGAGTQLFVKPTVFIGVESPGFWGFEGGIRVLGF